MFTIKVIASDLIRAEKTGNNPIKFAIAREFNEKLENIDVGSSNIIVWNDHDDDYSVYKYSDDCIYDVSDFIDYWADYIDGHTDICPDPFDFVVNQTHKKVEDHA